MSGDYEQRYHVLFKNSKEPVGYFTDTRLDDEIQALKTRTEEESHCECLRSAQCLLAYDFELRCYRDWEHRRR